MKAQIKSCYKLWTLPEVHLGELSALIWGTNGPQLLPCLMDQKYTHVYSTSMPTEVGFNFLCASGIKSVSFCFDAKMSVPRCPGWGSTLHILLPTALLSTQLAADRPWTLTQIPRRVGEQKGKKKNYVTNLRPEEPERHASFISLSPINCCLFESPFPN